jgi:hypothetical protein
MDPQEMMGSGFGKHMKNMFKDAKQAVIPVFRDKANEMMDGRRLLTPGMDNALQKMGVKQLVYNAGTSLKPNVQQTINGQGILGKKFDNMLKKKGVKQIVYKTAGAFKPLVHQAIDAVATTASAYGIPIAPVSNFAHNYIDHPDQAQAQVRNMVGNGVRPKTHVRDDSRSVIDYQNANFYPIAPPTFKQRQRGGSFKI